MKTPFEQGDAVEFDEAKYKSLLERLEISEVNLAYVLSNNKVFRFDSNYFQKQYLFEENLIRKKDDKNLKYLNERLASFGAYSLNNFITYVDSGIPFIRGINLKRGIVDFSDMFYITNTANDLLWKSKVIPLTILLSMSGTLGDVAIASKKWNYPINSNQDIAKIVCNKELNPYFLYTFLLSKYGQNYMHREARGSVQQHVFLSQIELFEIPLLTKEFQNEIERIVIESENLLLSSQQTYQQAETLLLETLGLSDFEPIHEKVNIKSFNQSFAQSGRLDAEYFEKKYDEIENRITESGNYGCLGNLIKSIDTGEYAHQYLQKEEKEGLTFYIRSTNLQNGQVQIDNNYFVERDSFKRIAKAGDILTARVGSVGVFGAVNQQTEGSVYSDNVLCIRFREGFISNVYTLLFNSSLYFELINRLARGSVQQRLNQETLKQLIIPIIDYSKQIRIERKVTESFRLRKQSEQLLEMAKTAVEMAIEKSEEEAMMWMQDETKALTLS